MENKYEKTDHLNERLSQFLENEENNIVSDASQDTDTSFMYKTVCYAGNYDMYCSRFDYVQKDGKYIEKKHRLRICKDDKGKIHNVHVDATGVRRRDKDSKDVNKGPLFYCADCSQRRDHHSFLD